MMGSNQDMGCDRVGGDKLGRWPDHGPRLAHKPRPDYTCNQIMAVIWITSRDHGTGPHYGRGNRVGEDLALERAVDALLPQNLFGTLASRTITQGDLML
jgi:hypothetical protein